MPLIIGGSIIGLAAVGAVAFLSPRPEPVPQNPAKKPQTVEEQAQEKANKILGKTDKATPSAPAATNTPKKPDGTQSVNPKPTDSQAVTSTDKKTTTPAEEAPIVLPLEVTASHAKQSYNYLYEDKRGKVKLTADTVLFSHVFDENDQLPKSNWVTSQRLGSFETRQSPIKSLEFETAAGTKRCKYVATPATDDGWRYTISIPEGHEGDFVLTTFVSQVGTLTTAVLYSQDKKLIPLKGIDGSEQETISPKYAGSSTYRMQFKFTNPEPGKKYYLDIISDGKLTSVADAHMAVEALVIQKADQANQ